MLGCTRILVAEDNALIALDVADGIIAVGGDLLGPFASVAGALRALEGNSIDAAILDANLADRDVTPLAKALHARAVPFIVYTGSGLPEALRQCAPDIPVISKPASIDGLIDRLTQLITIRAAPRPSLPPVATAA